MRYIDKYERPIALEGAIRSATSGATRKSIKARREKAIITRISLSYGARILLQSLC
ncbi:MAG: hypothetical protein F7C07_02470 [Desulfurococcales archaeon]|nr:hypothetical protein [Desulfurococcales archaeon]